MNAESQRADKAQLDLIDAENCGPLPPPHPYTPCALSKTSQYVPRTVLYFAGQRADTSYLDPIKVEDAPPEAIRLAAAELALRVQEERRRRSAGLGENPEEMTHQRMTGKPGMLPSWRPFSVPLISPVAGGRSHPHNFRYRVLQHRNGRNASGKSN